MFRSSSKQIFNVLAALAVLIQAFLPASAALGQAAGLDVSQYLCVTVDAGPSERAKQFARDFAELVTGEDSNERSYSGHCPFCVLTAPATLPDQQSISAPTFYSVGIRPDFSNPDYVALQRGPPVGLRAPPTPI